MSHLAVPSLLPSATRKKPRWSVGKSIPALSRQPFGLPASIAGLPATRAWVSVGPPLLFKGARICTSDTLGTMSVGPGVKPVTPALPLVPNKLKLFALTMLLVCYFWRNGRLVARDNAIAQNHGSRRTRMIKFAVATIRGVSVR